MAIASSGLSRSNTMNRLSGFLRGGQVDEYTPEQQYIVEPKSINLDLNQLTSQLRSQMTFDCVEDLLTSVLDSRDKLARDVTLNESVQVLCLLVTPAVWDIGVSQVKFWIRDPTCRGLWGPWSSLERGG